MPAETTGRPAGRSVIAILWRVLRIVAIVYLGVILVLLLLENRMIYYPVTAADSWEEPFDKAWRDVYLTTSDGTRVHAWWCPRDGADGALLYCHGNAGNLSHRREPIAVMQRALNVNVLIFDYPGYGKSAGSPSEAGCYAAGAAAYDWLTDPQADGGPKTPGEKVILFGSSLGGGIATYLAAEPRDDGTPRPYRALILDKTFTSLPDVGQRIYPWLPVRWVMRTRFDNLSRIPRCTKPVIIAHGRCDALIPCDHAETLYAAANEPKWLSLSDNGDHNSWLTVEFYREAKRFIEKHEK